MTPPLRGFIGAWADREGRIWLETGKLHGATKEPIIELTNGESSGALSWVNREFGPLEDLSVRSRARARSPRP